MVFATPQAMAPRVSVITIFLNAERFIREAIASVLAQSYPDWELLLVDDGSTDGSTQIARSYAEHHKDRIRYCEHEQHTNRGMSASRNLGARVSNGKYVAFLDADDVWLHHKLARQVAILDSTPEAALVYGASQYWYSWTGFPRDVMRDYVCDIGVCPDTLFQPCALLNLLLRGLHSPGPSDFMVRREALHRVGGFEETFRGNYEDQAFLAKAYLQEPVFVSSECWDRYRIHDDACSAIVTKAGQHHAARLSFLHWLKEYLADRQVDDADLLTNLRHALALRVDGVVPDQPKLDGSYLSDDSETRRMNWWLKVEEGNIADLDLRDHGDAVRITIEQSGTDSLYDLQLNYTRLRVCANQQYDVEFTARADGHRRMSVGVAHSYPPWNSLGLYDQIELMPQWRSFKRRFTAHDDSINARIHFDMGGDAASVEISHVRLRAVVGDKLVEPDLPGPYGAWDSLTDKLLLTRTSR